MSQSHATLVTEAVLVPIVMVVGGTLILVMVDVEYVEALAVVQDVMEREYIKYMINDDKEICRAGDTRGVYRN